MSYTTFSFVFGELIMVTIFAATRPMAIKYQYIVCSICIAALTCILACLIREPKVRDKTLTQADQDVKKSTIETLKKLSADVWTEIKGNPKYTFVFVCLFSSRIIIVLFS